VVPEKKGRGPTLVTNSSIVGDKSPLHSLTKVSQFSMMILTAPGEEAAALQSTRFRAAAVSNLLDPNSHWGSNMCAKVVPSKPVGRYQKVQAKLTGG
jgi:hypothetical protein